MSHVEETIKRIQSQKGVTGVIVMDSAGTFFLNKSLLYSYFLYKIYLGRAIRSTLDDEATAQHCALFQQLSDKAKSVVEEVDGSNGITFLRLRTKKNEYMIAPNKDYCLIVIENLST